MPMREPLKARCLNAVIHKAKNVQKVLRTLIVRHQTVVHAN